jgi:hypothetical protein
MSFPRLLLDAEVHVAASSDSAQLALGFVVTIA